MITQAALPAMARRPKRAATMLDKCLLMNAPVRRHGQSVTSYVTLIERRLSLEWA